VVGGPCNSQHQFFPSEVSNKRQDQHQSLKDTYKAYHCDELMRERIASMRNAWDGRSILETTEFKTFQIISEDEELASLHYIVTTTLRYQTLFRTRSRRLGMAPYSIQNGDRIALFSGMPYPMVVRPHGQRWRLITTAYVHGVMYGEAWDEKELEDIVLV
jgi:hypothetical protein